MFFIISFLSYRFKNEPSVDKDEDPLGWWKTKRLEYPTLTRLVKKFLYVPATSTQAERVFSWMGWLLNKRRLCLSGESVKSQTLLEGTSLDWLIFTLSTINWSISKMDLLKSEFTCFRLFNCYLSLFVKVCSTNFNINRLFISHESIFLFLCGTLIVRIKL